jgi:hypothetical protein
MVVHYRELGKSSFLLAIGSFRGLPLTAAG